MRKKGWHHTPESCKKISESRKNKFKTGEFDFHGNNNPFYGRHHTQETKDIIGKKNTGKTHTMEERANISRRTKGRHHSEETKKKIKESNIGKHPQYGENNPFYGKTHTENTIQKIKDSRKKFYNSPRGVEVRKVMSEFHKQLWQIPEYIQQQMQSRHNKPNKKELEMEQHLDEWKPNEFKYVGDGQVIIGGKCPDFININGKKQIIELFGTFWHSEKITGKPETIHAQERIDIFAQYGYKTLIIWEHELKDLETLKQKIINFVDKN